MTDRLYGVPPSKVPAEPPSTAPAVPTSRDLHAAAAADVRARAEAARAATTRPRRRGAAVAPVEVPGPALAALDNAATAYLSPADLAAWRSLSVGGRAALLALYERQVLAFHVPLLTKRHDAERAHALRTREDQLRREFAQELQRRTSTAAARENGRKGAAASRNR